MQQNTKLCSTFSGNLNQSVEDSNVIAGIFPILHVELVDSSKCSFAVDANTNCRNEWLPGSVIVELPKMVWYVPVQAWTDTQYTLVSSNSIKIVKKWWALVYFSIKKKKKAN